MDGFAALLWRMLDAARVGGPIVLGGNSFGAMLALHAAVASPDRVAGLALLSGCASGRQIGPFLRRCYAVLRRLPSRWLAPFLVARERASRFGAAARWLTGIGHLAVGPFEGMPPEGWEILARHIGVWPIEQLRASIDALMAWDVRDRVGAVRAPALVLHGTCDRLVPYRAGAWLGAALPGARFVALRGAGHAPMITRPGETAAAIRRLLREVDAAAPSS